MICEHFTTQHEMFKQVFNEVFSCIKKRKMFSLFGLFDCKNLYVLKLLVWIHLPGLLFVLSLDFFPIQQNKKFFSRNLRENTFWLPRKNFVFTFSIAGAFRRVVVLSFCTNSQDLGFELLWNFCFFHHITFRHHWRASPRNQTCSEWNYCDYFHLLNLAHFTSVVFVFFHPQITV